MTVSLGLQCGHDAGCAVVRDGRLVAALQQERLSRRKHDGQEPLSARLPIEATLSAAGVGLDDVDVIVTSFQAASPGGIGLVRPLVSKGFDLFDPDDERHLVVSHHLAHALGSFGLSGFESCAVLVCDLAGSTTLDGRDFLLPFPAFVADLRQLAAVRPTVTECLSIYSVDPSGVEMLDRQTITPHNQPDVFVQGPASLYDNAARAVFGSEHAHGQLMALAALDVPAGVEPFPELVSVEADGAAPPVFRNDWQHRFGTGASFDEQVRFARRVQHDMELALLAHARRARLLTGRRRLAVAGGVFLNIVANTRIATEVGWDRCFVPSAPHDAGIAVGCAVAGWQRLTERTAPLAGASSDRLGPRYDGDRHAAAARRLGVDAARAGVTAAEVAELLAAGDIVARVDGRSEFGPRALGGRSLLASPLDASSKDRLNAIKGRQPWRPVAPVVPRHRIAEFFTGPQDSPYMTFAHVIRPEARAALPALEHPDGSTRAQTLKRSADPFLFDVLEAFGALTGFPILVNTSLNGKGEPIVETPEEGVELFLSHPDVDLLVLGDVLVRRSPVEPLLVQVAKDALVGLVRPGATSAAILVRGAESMAISKQAHRALTAEEAVVVAGQPPAVRAELALAVRRGFLTEPAAAPSDGVLA